MFGPDGLLDAYIAMIPKTDGDDLLVLSRLSIVSGLLLVWVVGSSLGYLILSSVLGDGRGEGVVVGGGAWYATALDIEQVLTGATD